MSVENGRFYEFGDFRLDPAAKTLFCQNAPVALTPKVFDTLQFMVEHAGRLLEKDELMQNIWRDRFVEESNLTFNIKMLRRALQDDAHRPRFIETVPRRGYRFIAPVKQISTPLPAATVNDVLPVVPVRQQRNKFYWAVPVALVLLAGAAAIGTWLWLQRHTAASAHAPILSAVFKSRKLSNTGSVHALITPDGKYVAYTNESGGKQSIWLRQIETSENIQIVPPGDVSFLGLAISHDGNALYFVRRDRTDQTSAAIYRVMTFGGIPVKIADRSEGWIAVSPDDKQVSFVRCAYQPNDYCSLFVVGSDGHNERRILTRQKPVRITSNMFSADGRSIVFAAGESRSGAQAFHLLRVDLAGGAETEVSPSAFFVVNRIESLPGNAGFLFSARERLNENSRIWQVSAAGEIKALTNDSADYNDISMNRSGDRLVATQVSNSFRLHLATVAELGNPRVLIAARSVTFTPDGRLVHSTDDGDIWTINSDGSEQRQLTSSSFHDFSPRVSPDGRYIFFASNRTGANHVWRMNADGSNQIQITRSESGYPQKVTLDGKHVYFQSGRDQTVWQVPVDGGEEIQLLGKGVYAPAFSGEGKLIAYFANDSHNRPGIAVVELENQKLLHTFGLGRESADPLKIVWAPDGRSLIYVIANGARNSLWEQTLAGAAPRLIADMGSDDIEDFALSPDGRTFAFARGKWIHDAILIEGLR
jgi:Tol biopolymer transport system component/DNA-binding winged helix-turn-helix (wHTH) protein